MDFWARYAIAIAAIGLMLGGLGAVGRLVRRGRGRRTGRRMRVLESLALTPQAALHLVQIDAREFAVGTGPVSAPLFVGELLDRVEPAIGEVDLLVEGEDGALGNRA